MFLKEVVINVFVLHVKKHDKASHKATTTAILVVGLKSFVQICSKFIYKYSSAKTRGELHGILLNGNFQVDDSVKQLMYSKLTSTRTCVDLLFLSEMW